ncbi:MAG: carbohydrate-binding domain-containing protein [Paludibacteraceae bacterium]|nr:carbohydrate-binding domain-containing protein [Paludibacteraceae bacterium]
MKRNIILIACMFIGLFVWAQTTIIFHFGSDKASLSTESVDTIRFKDGKILLESQDGKTTDYALNDIDSVTFGMEKGDTVFVTYKGRSVTVDNPFDNIEVVTDGSDVNIISSEEQKGIVYYLSGSSDNGSFSLTPDKGYTLVLDNLSLTCETAPIILNKGLDDESYAATIYLKGKSTLADSENNNLKATLYSKSKLKFNDLENGSLTIKGEKQHAINSSKRVEIYSGKVSIDGAKGDGINADGLEMYGGTLSISGTASDGVDCSELIRIEDGTIDLNVASDDTKGLKCDSVIEIVGGKVSAEVTGKGSKAVKAKGKVTVSGGELNASLNAKEPFAGTNNDYGYNAAIACDGDIEINQEGKVNVTGAGIAAKGFNADANVIFNGGETSINLTGKQYDEKANKDTVSCTGVKCDGKFTLTDGKVEINIGSDAYLCKGIKADGDMEIFGGDLTIKIEGGYYITGKTQSGGGGGGGWSFGGSSSKTIYSYASPKIIKAGKNFTMTGGSANLTATLGKGIMCDGDVIIGEKNGDDENLKLIINAGSQKNETHSHTESIEGTRTKAHGSPKGIKAGHNLTINSGCIDIYAYDTGILAEDVLTVNNGNIEVDAPYDQALFGKKELIIDGGNITVPSSYEAFSGISITVGGDSRTYVIASDDAWNATKGNSGSGTAQADKDTHIYLNGGVHYARAQGDGIDSNGDMVISGGILVVAQRHELDSPLDSGSGITHKGGFVLAVGGNGMFDEAIPVASVGHIYNKRFRINANQYFVVANNSGNVIAALKMPFNPAEGSGFGWGGGGGDDNKNGAVCAYNADIRNYNFYVGDRFDGELNYFDEYGFYESGQHYNINQLQKLDVSTENGTGGAW